MTWFYPELVQRVQAVLPPGLHVQTQLPPGQSAWLAVPVFAYAKQLDEPLPTAARDVAKRIETLGDVIVDVIGGFVNVTPTQDALARALRQAKEDLFGSLALGDGRTIVMDYSHPNIAKPMSVGHLRSTIIGDALRRVYEALGYQVIGINYLGDWGTQYGKLVVAYQQKYGDLTPRDSVTIDELFGLYVQYHADTQGQDELDQAARAAFKRLEEGDAAVRALWQFFIDLSLLEFQKLYDRLNVSFTEPTMGESFHRNQFDAVSELVRSKGVVETSESAEIVRVEGFKAPLILRKSDGATTYATRDLAALKYRAETYQPASILYVVSNEQTLHFQQVFAVAQQVGLVPDSVGLEHVKFGFLRLPEGKMSTRAGRIVRLEELLDEAVSRARAAVDEKNPDLSVGDRERIAETVGVAAVKFFDLMHERNHDIVFDWDRMLNLKGDSAPYLLYSYTRAASILRKVNETESQQDIESIPTELSGVVRSLARFPLVLESVAADNAPHHLAQYLNQVATEFHAFYEQFPVLRAEGNDRVARLAVVRATATVLRRGLDHLGIQVLEEM